MCSNSGCSSEDIIPHEDKVVPGKNIVCPRCNLNKGDVVLRAKDIYCKSCLLQYLNHKFRAALGTSKLMRPHDRVLVAYSGSHSSTALVHLLKQGMNLSSHKRILFSACLLYIDDTSILNINKDERQRLNIEISNSMKDFESHFVPLEQAIVSGDCQIYSNVEELPLDSPNEDNLRKMFDSMTSLSSKQHLLQTLRNKLLLKVAEKLNCTKIFTAECLTDLASKIIANISLGKGAHVPLDVGFCDNRTDKIITLRPLRDFSSKEVVYYNMFNHLTATIVPSLATFADPWSSLQKAAETFITDLQSNFPSTVSTVFRTADKLSLNLDNLDPNLICSLCLAPLDTKSQQNLALQATSFSNLVSNSTKDQIDLLDLDVDVTSKDCQELNSKFCYACQYAVKEMSIEDVDKITS